MNNFSTHTCEMDNLRQGFSEHLKNAKFKEFEGVSFNGCSVKNE